MTPARMVCFRKSRPSVAEMLLKPTSRISSGSEPNFRTVTRLVASAGREAAADLGPAAEARGVDGRAPT